MADPEMIEVKVEAGGERLDKFLSLSCPALSRSRIQALIEEGCVHENGVKLADGARKVKPGETYTITIPPLAPTHILAQDIALDVMFEDAHLLVINKPAGMTVHPAPGSPDSTLVNALLAHCGESLSGIGGVARPGIVHRIDKETSGLLVVAKNDAAHAALSAQLQSRELKRIYLALCWGVPRTKKGSIHGNIARHKINRQKMAVVKSGGREATTHYEVIEEFGDLVSLVRCQLETGRTHQIRVHMAHIGHSLLGDPVYGGSGKKPALIKALGENASNFKELNRQALHAEQMRFRHPVSGEQMQFRASLPKDMENLLGNLQHLS